MSDKEEKYFQQICPMKSCLGREFLTLSAERDKQKSVFESVKNKMDFDTQPYRRSEIAVSVFLTYTLPLIDNYNRKVPLSSHQNLELMTGRSRPSIDRQSERIIWVRFAIERYRELIHTEDKKKYRMYHPVLWKELHDSARMFWKEISKWVYGHQPFDGSQAMHSMINFQVAVRSLACANE